MADSWTHSDPQWLALDPYQRAAAMSMMEANAGPNAAQDRTNVLGAMINRSNAEGVPLGESVSARIYQPTFEPSQQARLSRILADPAHADLAAQAQRYATGAEPVPHGATHFLAPEKTMLALEAREPNKYRSWRGWTGFNDKTGEYSGVQFRDASHAFLTPGGNSAPRPPQAQQQAAAPRLPAFPWSPAAGLFADRFAGQSQAAPSASFADRFAAAPSEAAPPTPQEQMNAYAQQQHDAQQLAQMMAPVQLQQPPPLQAPQFQVRKFAQPPATAPGLRYYKR